MLRTKRIVGLLASLVLILVTLPAWGATKADDEETLRNAATVLQAMLIQQGYPAQRAAKG